MFDCDTNYIELEVEENGKSTKKVIFFDIEDINADISILYNRMNYLLEHDMPIDTETIELFHALTDLKYGFLAPLKQIYDKYLNVGKYADSKEAPLYLQHMRETFTVMSKEKFLENYGNDFPVLRR